MTTASPAANTLRVLLGDRFLCGVCKQHHTPNSRLIAACRRKLAFQELRELRADDHRSWRPLIDHYYARLKWYTAQRRLTESETKIITQLLTEIQQCTIYKSFGSATLAEIASPDGKALLAARYAQWKQTVDAQIARAAADSDQLVQRLETLLPLPYPADPPTGNSQNNPRRKPPHWTPAPSSQAEIDRVAALFSPPAKITRSGYRIILTGAVPNRLPDITSYRHNGVDLELLGLDSTFWHHAELSDRRKRLKLCTRSFALTSPEPPEKPEGSAAPSEPPRRSSEAPPEPSQCSSQTPPKPFQLLLFPKDSGL